jgi:hypothetical protein
MRVVAHARENVVFTVGAEPRLQFCIIEALIELVVEEFLSKFGTETRCNEFYNEGYDFEKPIESILEKIPGQVFFVRTPCRLCEDKYVGIFVKKSIIDNATYYPVSLVFKHDSHALLIYIDRDYKVRGSEIAWLNG